MQRVLAALPPAELLQLQAFLRVPPVLGGVIVVLLAHRAFERDGGSDIFGHTELRYHGIAPP